MALGCGGESRDLNVLILTLDTTRADHLGCYGYDEATSPRLDSFASERAVLFHNAISTVPITFPSHASILTGTYPAFHGVHDNDGFYLDDDVTTLAEILGPQGYATGAVIASFPLDSQFNLDQGFDDYNDDYQEDWTQDEIDGRTPLSFGFVERTADRVNLSAFRWLDEHADERFFLWMHYFDPHQAYSPPRPYDSQFASQPYDGEIAFVDECFGELVDYLEDRDLLHNTVIVVVGDHGESLDQHGEPTHATFVYDSTMRVPLIISAPGNQAAGGIVRRQVRTIDIAPTLLDLLGFPADPDMQGASLLLDLRDPETPRPAPPALLETRFCQYHYKWAPLRALRTDEWKYILAPTPELYDLQYDPDERFNLASSRPDLVRELDVQLEEYAASVSAVDVDRSTATSVDSSVRQRLEALGYLTGGGAADRASPFPPREQLAEMQNPMEHALVLNHVNSANEMLRQQNYSDAIGVARRGLEIDPSNSRLQNAVARAWIGLDNLEQALVELDRTAEINPSIAQTHVLRGRVLATLGRFEEARDSLIVAGNLERNNVESLEALGALHLLLGAAEDAVDVYQRALEIDDGSWSIHLGLASALADVGRSEEARTSFQEALSRNPFSPIVLDKIAQFYISMGDLAFARRALEEAVRIRPEEPSYRLHLGGLLLTIEGSEELGRAELEKVVSLAPDSIEAAMARTLLDRKPPDPQSSEMSD